MHFRQCAKVCILDSVPKCAKVCQSVPTAWESSLGELVVRMKNKVSLLNLFKVCILDRVPKCANSLGQQNKTRKNKTKQKNVIQKAVLALAQP